MLFNMILIIVLIICFVTDILKQKIYNIVIFPSFFIAIFLNIYYYGISGLQTFFFGFITGLCILIIPYFLGGMGAGDVKLLAIIGALKGTLFVLNTAIYMALIGGIIALLIIVLQRQTLNFFKTFCLWLLSFFNGINYKLEFPTSSFTKKYPYGIAIVLGAMTCLLFKEAWII